MAADDLSALEQAARDAAQVAEETAFAAAAAGDVAAVAVVEARKAGAAYAVALQQSQVEPPPESNPELPVSTRFVEAATYTEFRAALDDARPGTCITLTNLARKAYAGGTVTKTLSGVEGNPIVVRGPADGIACERDAVPTLPFDLRLSGSDVVFYGLALDRGQSDMTNNRTVELPTSSARFTFRRVWGFRKFGRLIQPLGKDHTFDFCNFSVWGRQEVPTTDGKPPANDKSNWLPEGKFGIIADGGSSSVRITARRNYIHDCPFKQPSSYHHHGISGFAIGDNPSEALEETFWLVKENLIFKGGHMDLSCKTSKNIWQGNCIDGQDNKVNYNQRSGNYNKWLSNWNDTGSYNPIFTVHGGYNEYIGNYIRANSYIATMYGNRPWNHTFSSADKVDTRCHQAYRTLVYGNTGTLRDGYNGSSAMTVACEEAKFTPGDGHVYEAGTGSSAPKNSNKNADAPERTVVPAVKLTAAMVGPTAPWIAP